MKGLGIVVEQDRPGYYGRIHAVASDSAAGLGSGAAAVVYVVGYVRRVEGEAFAAGVGYTEGLGEPFVVVLVVAVAFSVVLTVHVVLHVPGLVPVVLEDVLVVVPGAVRVVLGIVRVGFDIAPVLVLEIVLELIPGKLDQESDSFESVPVPVLVFVPDFDFGRPESPGVDP